MNNPTLRDFPFSNKFLGPIRKLRNTLFQLRKDESNLALAIRFMVLLAGLGEMLYLLHETYLIQTKGALTLDYTVFEQARYLIAHGHINPFDTVRGRGFYFYKDHFELIIWPLAWISAIVPLPSWIYMRVIIEVLPVTLSFFITVKWSREILAERIKKDWLRELTVALISSTIITSVGIYSAVAFDIHLQMLIGFLLLLGARVIQEEPYCRLDFGSGTTCLGRSRSDDGIWPRNYSINASDPSETCLRNDGKRNCNLYPHSSHS